jgi:dihydrofolate reductase
MPMKVILYIAASLDGYIAGPGDDLSFLSMVETPGEDYGYVDFTQSVDTVIMGRKTYDWIMKQVPVFPHADKESYILTRTAKDSIGNTHFYTGDLRELVQTLKAKGGKNIFCDGGADAANALLQLGLMDEIIISTIPVILGAGTKLFKEGIPERALQLLGSKSFSSGLIQAHYKLI